MLDPNDLDNKIVAFLNFETGTAIDLSGGNSDPADGTACIGYQDHLHENQQWKLVKVKTGGGNKPVFRLENVKAPQKAIDLYNGSSDNGTKITAWAHNSSTTNEHQLWYIHPVGTWAGHGTVVKIENYGTNTFVDLYNGGSANGTSIVGWEGNLQARGTHQLWFLKYI